MEAQTTFDYILLLLHLKPLSGKQFIIIAINF